MLNQQLTTGRWTYSYTLGRHIFIDEKKRIIDPNVGLLKSNVVPVPAPIGVADPTLQFVQQAAENINTNALICNEVATNVVVENQNIEPEVIWEVPTQPIVEEKSRVVVPAVPNQRPAPAHPAAPELKKEKELEMPIRAPPLQQVSRTKQPEVSNRNAALPQVPKSKEQEVKEVATSSYISVAQEPKTNKAKATIKVDNTGAYNPPKKQKEEWSTVKKRRKRNNTERQNRPTPSPLKRNERKGYRNRRYMDMSRLLGPNWKKVQADAQNRAAAPKPTTQNVGNNSAPARRNTAPTRNVGRYSAPARRHTAAPTRNVGNYSAPARRPAAPPRRRQYTVPVNATKLVPPITLDKLQGRWINSRNQRVEVRGRNYTFSTGDTGRFEETDEEFFVNDWILQKSGNVVLWYNPGNENITWRRIGGAAAPAPVNTAASEAQDYASTRRNCKVVHLNCRTTLRAGPNLASRFVKNFEKDEPLVVETTSLCTLGANDNNEVRIKVVFPCKGWINKFQPDGKARYRSMK